MDRWRCRRSVGDCFLSVRRCCFLCTVALYPTKECTRVQTVCQPDQQYHGTHGQKRDTGIEAKKVFQGRRRRVSTSIQQGEVGYCQVVYRLQQVSWEQQEEEYPSPPYGRFDEGILLDSRILERENDAVGHAQVSFKGERQGVWTVRRPSDGNASGESLWLRCYESCCVVFLGNLRHGRSAGDRLSVLLPLPNRRFIESDGTILCSCHRWKKEKQGTRCCSREDSY
mmetsp:Transcript_19168/g.28391  ORF Transcript_19168/g.28391 Transcript_19168/m.28391 type:complete len:226 (-) Transcript_19168:524-1201(-)